MPGALATITVKDAANVDRTQRVWDESGTGVGPYQVIDQIANAAGTVINPATSEKQDTANTSLASLANQTAGEYETVAASQTAQVLGGAGAANDYIKRVVIIPLTTAPGLVTLLDGATSIPLWLGGTVGADLKPFVIELGMKCATAWKITTGANVSVIAVGNFT